MSVDATEVIQAVVVPKERPVAPQKSTWEKAIGGLKNGSPKEVLRAFASRENKPHEKMTLPKEGEVSWAEVIGFVGDYQDELSVNVFNAHRDKFPAAQDQKELVVDRDQNIAVAARGAHREITVYMPSEQVGPEEDLNEKPRVEFRYNLKDNKWQADDAVLRRAGPGSGYHVAKPSNSYYSDGRGGLVNAMEVGRSARDMVKAVDVHRALDRYMPQESPVSEVSPSVK